MGPELAGDLLMNRHRGIVLNVDHVDIDITCTRRSIQPASISGPSLLGPTSPLCRLPRWLLPVAAAALHRAARRSFRLRFAFGSEYGG
jgi:hypothetical protein